MEAWVISLGRGSPEGSGTWKAAWSGVLEGKRPDQETAVSEKADLAATMLPFPHDCTGKKLPPIVNPVHPMGFRDVEFISQMNSQSMILFDSLF